MTVVMGLTGGIGMGKSAVAQMLVDLGVPVFNADRYVHRLMNKGGAAVKAVSQAFPGAYDRRSARINRAVLGELVFNQSEARKRVEKILHPLVRAAEERFIRVHTTRRTPLIVLDVPLLFETAADRLCAAVMVVTAPPAVQRARVLARPGQSPKKFAAIKASQMPDRTRRARADYILSTDQSLAATRRDLQRILRAVLKDHARNCP